MPLAVVVERLVGRRRRVRELHLTLQHPVVEVVRRARRDEARDFRAPFQAHALAIGHAHRAAGGRDLCVAGAHGQLGRAARRDVDAVFARHPDADRRVQRDDFETLVLEQVAQVQAHRAGGQLEADGRGVELGDGGGGRLVEVQRGVAERQFRAPVAAGREAIAREQRAVGQGGRRDFLRALERDFALQVSEPRKAFRRLAGGEARGREREDDEEGAQHGDSMIRPDR